MANNGRSSPLLQLFARSPIDGAAAEDKNGSSSTLMRSLSKCFEPPLDEAIIDENGIGVTASKAVKGKCWNCRRVMRCRHCHVWL